MPAKISRPGRWWREPLTRAQLSAIDADLRDAAISNAREIRTAKLKEQLRLVRQYSKDFSPSNGYTLRERELIRLAPSKLEKLRHAAIQLANALSRPHVTVSPRTKAQIKSTARRAGKLFPSQTKYIVHTLQASRTKPRFRDGQLELVIKLKKGEIIERLYLFPRSPRSWDDVYDMTEVIQRRGIKTGYYKLYSSLYGPIANAVSHDRMLRSLNEFFSTYRNEMSQGILGWQWIGSTYQSQRKRQKQQFTTEERFKQIRDFNNFKRERLAYERVTESKLLKRCKKCKRKRCKCKAPTFK